MAEKKESKKKVTKKNTGKEHGDSSAKPAEKAGKKEDDLLDWLKGGDVAVMPSAPDEEPESAEALKRWLGGEDDAFHRWLNEEEVGGGAASSEIMEELKEKERELKKRDEEIERLKRQISDMEDEISGMQNIIREELQKYAKSGFNPDEIVKEREELRLELQKSRKEIARYKEEIEKLKKGSVALIKYVKNQQKRMKDEGIRELKAKLEGAEQSRKWLELQLKAKEQQIALLKEKLPEDEKAAKEREMQLIEKEAELKTKEGELEVLQNKITQISSQASEDRVDQLRNQFEAELNSKEAEFAKKEEEYQEKIRQLQTEIETMKAQVSDELVKDMEKWKDLPDAKRKLIERERELLSKEKAIEIREKEIEKLKEQLKFKEDEIEKLKEPLKFKEDELLRREEDLRHREEVLKAELRKMQQQQQEVGTVEEQEMKRRLEELEREIAKKEEELKVREQYINAKMEELHQKEQGLVEEEIESREKEIKLELKQEKIKTGTSRLDDLLYGGFPLGANVLLYGPAFVGKEVLINAFIAEGLKKGIPGVWVLTDKSVGQIREEMMFVLPTYEEYENMGLVKYVDAYSRSMGETTEDPNTVYVDETTDTNSILKAVDEIGAEFKKKHPYYRLAFMSVSTLIAYLDPNTAFKFLQPFVGKRKRERAVSLYSIEKGMHSETDISMLGHLMDGTIEFKVENLRNFLSVRGICDVQSRAWIRYTFSKSGVDMGSFSLDKIR